MKNKIFVLIIINFIFSLRMIGSYTIFSAFAFYGHNLSNSNDFLIGIAIGIYNLSQAIFQIPFGVLSDFVGRKKTILICLIIFFFGNFLNSFFKNIWIIIFGRFIQGLAAVSSTCMALIIDYFGKNFYKIIPIIGVNLFITFLISNSIGPYIAYLFGLNGVFFFISILSLFCIFLSYFFLPNTKNKCNNFKNVKNIIKNIYSFKLFLLYSNLFFLHFVLSFNLFFFPKIILNTKFFSHKIWILIFVFSFFVSLIFIYIILKIKHLVNLLKLIFMIIILMFFSEIFLFSLKNIFYYFIFIFIFIVIFSILEVLFPLFFKNNSSFDKKGSIIGIYSFYQFLGSSLGSILSSWFFLLFNLNNIFLFIFIIFLVWIISFLIYVKLENSDFL
ncbi:MAG: MFS transporter [Enterobacteriaceae bacterium]